MAEKIPDSFDHQQPDVPTLAVDPDPQNVTKDGQKPGKYPADGVEDESPAPRADR